MENYNLTAELKKIASGITTSDPNTELGNINSGVGNLDTAMQGVATAINGLSIPNPGSNIDGVAEAINNKTIPDNTSNITAVANAIVSMAGGKDLDDLISILTTMNGNIANLGSNHITTILEAPGTSTGYQVLYGNGNMTPLTNQAEKTSYTDTNNLGATNVQGAIDKLSEITSGDVTLNGTYFSGYGSWQKVGKHVTVFLEITTIANLPNTNWATKLITNIPPIRTHNNGAKKFNLMARDLSHKPITLAATNSSGYDTTAIYSWDNNGVASGGSYMGSFDYFTF